MKSSTALASRLLLRRHTDRVLPTMLSPGHCTCYISSSTTSHSAVVPSQPEESSEHLPTSPIDFKVAVKIDGEESHVAKVKLSPNETLRAESGAMLFMTEGVVMDTKMEGASAAFSRMLTGQNVFLTDFRYEGNKGSFGTVCLGTDFPSKIMRFSLEDFDSNTLICQRGAFLASNPSVNIQMEFTKSLTAGFFGGQGFILQKLSGQGDVLIKGGGTVVKKTLETGETLRVTSGSIVAFEASVQYDVQMMAGVKNAMFGGEGLFVTSLTGPGQVWLQGMPADRMIAEIARRVPGPGVGLGVPIMMGGGGGGDAVEGGDTPDAGESAAHVDQEDAMASSGATETDGDSSAALFGDAAPANNNSDQSIASVENDEEAPIPTDTNEPTFKDDDFYTQGGDSYEGFEQQQQDGFDHETFDGNDGELFDDSTTMEGFGDEIEESGSGLLRSLWDLFTGGDD